MNKHISYSLFLANCKKDVSRTRIYYTYFYHQITYPLSYILYRLSFTANAISILGIFVSLVGGVLIFLDRPILGTVFFLVSYLLDCCDGNVARIHYGHEKRPRGESQSLGMLLENFYPNVSYPLFYISLGTYLFHLTGAIFFVWIAVVAGIVKLVTRYTVLHASHINKPEKKQETTTGSVLSVSQEALVGQTNKEIHSTGSLDEIKYFIVRVLDSARLYYVIFLVVLIAFPAWLPKIFVGYMTLIIILNVIKTLITLKTRKP